MCSLLGIHGLPPACKERLMDLHFPQFKVDSPPFHLPVYPSRPRSTPPILILHDHLQLRVRAVRVNPRRTSRRVRLSRGPKASRRCEEWPSDSIMVPPGGVKRPGSRRRRSLGVTSSDTSGLINPDPPNSPPTPSPPGTKS